MSINLISVINGSATYGSFKKEVANKHTCTGLLRFIPLSLRLVPECLSTVNISDHNIDITGVRRGGSFSFSYATQCIGINHDLHNLLLQRLALDV